MKAVLNIKKMTLQSEKERFNWSLFPLTVGFLHELTKQKIKYRKLGADRKT